MQKTNDYAIFKKHPSNRVIDPLNLKKIQNSLKMRNMLALKPIIVNDEMEIIDGQHRLEAAKSLKLTVYYEMQKECKPGDIVLLNNAQKKWSGLDYLSYHVSIGNENYTKFKNFMNKHSFSFSTMMSVVSNGKNAIDHEKFRKGEFLYPSPEEEKNMIDKLTYIEEIQKYIKAKTRGNKLYLQTPTFVRALLLFFNCTRFDFSTFFKKLEYQLDQIRPCTTISAYMNLFREIYNYKNSKPIEEFASV